MEEKKFNRILITGVIAIFAAASAIIITAFIILRRSSDIAEPEIMNPVNRTAFQSAVTANPGGNVPTHVPTSSPEPLKGMDSPALCKMELAGLNTRAKRAGAAGILTLNEYDIVKDTCVIDIRNMARPGNMGVIEIFHKNVDGNYGITLKIYKTEEDQMMKWGIAALLFFNSEIKYDEAESVIQKVLTEKSLKTEYYQISADESVLITEGSVRPIHEFRITSISAAGE